MKRNKSKWLLLAVAITLFSCETYDFEQEQYKQELNLQQEGDDAVFGTQCIDMEPETSNDGTFVQLVVNVGGSQRITSDLPVSIIHSDSLFKVYNKSNFDIDSTRFAKLLPQECYEEPTLKGVIKAGNTQVKFPIKLKNLDKLSPDTIYLLNYKIDASASAATNKKKSEVLLRIHWKNQYASTKMRTDYTYNSSSVIDLQTGSTRRPTNTVWAFPLSKNSVRMIAGDEDFGDYKKAKDQIRQKSVIYTVGKQLDVDPLKYQLTITPYDKKQMEVIQLTPLGEYDNTFYFNEQLAMGNGISTHYKEFRVHYKYRLLNPQKDGTNKPGPFKEVKAKLRLQYNPRADKL